MRSTAESLPATNAFPLPILPASLASSLPPAILLSIPSMVSPGASEFASDQLEDDTHHGIVAGIKSAPGRSSCDTHSTVAGGKGTDRDGEVHAICDTQPSLDFTALRVLAEMFYDVQKARIACANRASRAELDGTAYTPLLDVLENAEHQFALTLCRTFRKTAPPSIVAWQKGSRGIGEHLLARLLGHIGHPVYSTAHHWGGTGENRTLIDDGPIERRVSDLWSYCGHGDPERRKRRGQSPEDAAATGSPIAKMLVHLIAEGCMKAGGPYRDVYDERRSLTALSHPEWTKGHSHNDALRVAGKVILRDLWLVSRTDE